MAGTDPSRGNTGSHYARYFGVGFTFMLILGALAVGGFFVDRLVGTMPLFLLAGLVLGFALGLYYLYRILEKMGNL